MQNSSREGNSNGVSDSQRAKIKQSQTVIIKEPNQHGQNGMNLEDDRPGGSLLASGRSSIISKQTQDKPDRPACKEGYKYNEETGEEEKMTETEAGRAKLFNEIELTEKRIYDLELIGALFPKDYNEKLEESDSDALSDDSLISQTGAQETKGTFSHLQSTDKHQTSGNTGFQQSIQGPTNAQTPLRTVQTVIYGRHNQSMMERSGTNLEIPEDGIVNEQEFDTLAIDVTKQESGNNGNDAVMEESKDIVQLHNNTLTDMTIKQENTERSASTEIDFMKLGSKTLKQKSNEALQINEEEIEPDKIIGFHHLPITVQSQLRALAKVRKERTDRDINKLKLDVKEVEFFKSKNLDEATMTNIIASAGWSYKQKGKWVYQEDDKGDRLYLLLHGHCKALETNDDYLLFRRTFRDNLKKMFDSIDMCLDADKNLYKCQLGTVQHDEALANKLKCLKKQIRIRKALKSESVKLQHQGKFSQIQEYQPGDSFGEMSLLYDDPRQESIAASKSCFFLTITKESYQRYLKSFDKKQKEAVVEFFKNVPFLQGLSNQTILKLSECFKLKRFANAGQYVLREGDPVTHIALVKDGEFEVVKKNLRGIDQRIMGFLRKGDVRKKVAQKVLLLPGRTSIYQKTNLLIPEQENKINDAFLQDKSLDVEQLAFNSVSDKLLEIARQQAETGSKQNNSLNSLKHSNLDRYRDIRISINGRGYVFGHYDAYTHQKKFQYSLRSNRKGAECYVMEKYDFMKFCKQYHTMAKTIESSIYDIDRNMMRQLTRVVFSKWYTDLLQENLKVVPDLNNSGPSVTERNQPSSGVDYGAKSKPQNVTKSPVRSGAGSPQKLPAGIQKMTAEEIIQRSGGATDNTILREREADQMRDHAKRMRSSIESASSPSQPNEQQKQEPTRQDHRPKEKLQSQLNTIMPMEIVRAQPFFSMHSYNLRDQLDEYVQGFPATRAHRQIIAKAYNMNEEEPTYKVEPDATTQITATPEKNKTAKKMMVDSNDPIDYLVPDSDLPVDPQRLKKAIKTALIKNENNPDKIDIRSIMREQTRIHRHIQDFKQSRSKQPTQGGVTNNYFSSHIVKKIAEDQIHKSLKEICAKNLEETQDFNPRATGQLGQAQSTQNFQDLQSSPSKFQKLLATKYNQGFQSAILKGSKTQKQQEPTLMEKRILNLAQQSINSQSMRPVTEQLDGRDDQIYHQTVFNKDSRLVQSPPAIMINNDSEPLIEHNEDQDYSNPNISFNRISHKKIEVKSNLRKQTLSPAQGDYQNRNGPSPKRQRSQLAKVRVSAHSNGMVDQLIRSSHDKTNYTFFSNQGIANKRNSHGNDLGNKPIYYSQSKQHIQNQAQMSMRGQNNLHEVIGARGSFMNLRKPESMHIPGGYMTNQMENRQLPMKGNAQMGMMTMHSRANSRFIGNQLNKPQGGSRDRSNGRIQLAALFQPRDIRQSSQGGQIQNPYK